MTPAVALCTRCGQEPRLPRQRWGRHCLTAYKRARAARLRVLVEPVADPVTPAPLLAERPLCLCYLCGYSQWREHVPGFWVCGLCGVPPAT